MPTVSNSGTITATATANGANSVGIYLSGNAQTGSLSNSGTVSGGYNGVSLYNGTVSNTGTIESANTHISSAGLGDGGIRAIGNATVTNTGTGLISGYVNGIYALGGGTLSVTNSGTIQAHASAIPYGSYAIFALGGLTVSNSGVMTSRKYTVDGHGNDNHISNTGTITGGVAAVLVNGQGTVANNGGVMAGYAGVNFTDLGTVTNTGTISGTFNLSGVILDGGGYISNASSGIIQGVAAGATVSGAAGTVVNAGTITGAAGLKFDDFANTVIDTGTIVGTGGTAAIFGTANDLLKFNPSSSVKIQGTVDGGAGSNTLEFASAATAGTLTGVSADFVNFTEGTIDTGAYWVFAGTNTIDSTATLTNSGTLVDTGALTNAGTLKGSGVFIVDPTTFTNTGYLGLATTLTGTGDVFDNTSTGTVDVAGIAIVATGSAALVDNFRTIEGTGTGGFGVSLTAGGTVINGAGNATGALISARRYGVFAKNTAAAVTNYGTITATTVDDVYLGAGGSVANIGTAALLTSGFYAVEMKGAAAVSNSSGARILGASVGIRSPNFATIVNAGTITGTNKDGIYLKGGATVSNTDIAALISGGTYGIGVTNSALTLTNAGTITPARSAAIRTQCCSLRATTY